MSQENQTLCGSCRKKVINAIEEDLEPEHLINAPKQAKDSYPDEDIAMCSRREEVFSHEKKMKHCYVFSYAFDFRSNGCNTGNPCWKANHDLLNKATLFLSCTRNLILGLVRGLNVLPHKRFDTIYKGLKKNGQLKEGDVMYWPCLTTATKKRVVEPSPNDSEDGKPERTILIIKGAIGFDLEEFSSDEFGHEALMEPGTSVVVESTESCSVIKMDVNSSEAKK